MSGVPRLHPLNAAFGERVQSMVTAGVLAPEDVLVVDAVAPRFGEHDPEVLLGLALAVRAPRTGHVGVHLRTVCGRVDDEHALRRAGLPDADRDEPLTWPKDIQAWEASVLRSSLVGETTDSTRPFVRQKCAAGEVLLMTRRMWREQERLVDAVGRMVATPPRVSLPAQTVDEAVERLFDHRGSQGERAIRVAAMRRLTVVTGGPGVGKTYCIARLLALMLEACGTKETPLRIELAAPTGKAAVRMAESIAKERTKLKVAPSVQDALANLKPRTLHKLLGIRPDGTSRHTSERPVAADLVVVDEASMVDLRLMRRLFEAVPEGARLVLLGDRDQLASVDAGTVLSDIVSPVLDGSGDTARPLHGSVVHFDTNHRFGDAPTVAAIAAALQGVGVSAVADACAWMSGEQTADGETLPDRVTRLGGPVEGRPEMQQLDRLFAPYGAPGGYAELLGRALEEHGMGSTALCSTDLHLRLLKALPRYRVLCTHNRGPLGVSGIERELDRRCRAYLLKRARKYHNSEVHVQLKRKLGHWLGRPVLIRRNAYALGLMNGDIGLVLPTASGLAAVFPVRDGDQESTHEVALARLPPHSGALAMTVHKSQGSQFERVALVLAGRDSQIQTRELVYTAITRTSGRLDWLGDSEELRRALVRRVSRASGLGDLLWEPAPSM